MKEKIKNFLLKIKNYFTDKFACTRIKLIFFALIVSFITCLINMVNFTFTDSCYNETHTQHIENVESERNIIDRYINGANPTQSDYVNPGLSYDNIFFNTDIDYVINFFDNNTSLFYMPFSATEDVLPIYCYLNNQFSDIYHILLFSRLFYNSSYLYFINDVSILNGTIIENNVVSYLNSNYDSFDNAIVPFVSINSNGIYPNLELNGATIPIGFYNQQLYSIVSSKPFENESIVNTSILTLNETNFDGAINFSTFLTKETIAGYFSHLTYEETNFITPSLTLNNVDSYTIITGRIGTPPIANYIPSLVVVKYESKYVVYNYLRDNYLTPIYDTSTGVLENVLGDVNYFLNVSSPTYFGSENDKFNLFISAINIADSPLYSLISIGYENGYDFGYDRGFSVGEQTGFADGEESGFNEGYDTGYENGFNEGRDTANALGPVMSLFKDTANVVASVLNVQILPNLTIGTILLFPLVALLFALFVRLFFGG